MNSSQIKCLAVFSLFAIIGFGPISPGCLIGMYIVQKRPDWFLTLSGNVYQNPTLTVSLPANKQIRKHCFFSLLGLFIIDILPIPVTPIIAFYIILRRPLWFYQLVLSVYQAP